MEKVSEKLAKRREQMKLRARRTREKHLIYLKAYKRKKYREDDMYRLDQLIRKKIRRGMLTGNKWTAKSRLQEIVGCTATEFRAHIESQMEPWMNWDNYGKGAGTWQLDHTIPSSMAKDENELELLHHFTNMRPLSTLENVQRNRKENTWKMY